MSATSLDDEERNFVRQTKRGAARCGRVREAATALFLERGYDGVSLDDIIAVAGGSKSNIYSHFGGKEGLFVAAVETECDRATAALNSVDFADDDVEAGLKRLAAILVETVTNPRNTRLFRLIIAQSGRFPTLGPIWVTHGLQPSRRTLTLFLTRHQQRLRGICPEQAAIIFHNMLVWDVRIFALTGKSPLLDAPDTATHIERVVAQFAQGYLTPPSASS